MEKPNRDIIRHNRRVWSKFQSANLDGPISDLEELSKNLDQTISLLSMFPETESTRMYLASQLVSLNAILFYRKNSV